MDSHPKKLEFEFSSLVFTETHEWIFTEGDTAYIGVTELALSNFGAVVYIDLPLEGDEILTVVPFGEIEFLDNTFDINSPIEGEVVEINETLMNKLDIINLDPYKKGWLVKMVPDDITILSSLMNNEEYEKKFNIQLGKKNKVKKSVVHK